MVAKSLAEYDARIAELEALIAEAVSLPEEGSVGGVSYKQGSSRLKHLRSELDRVRRERARLLNGGVALATRRGC